MEVDRTPRQWRLQLQVLLPSGICEMKRRYLDIVISLLAQWLLILQLFGEILITLVNTSVVLQGDEYADYKL
jgi:hypothetical protein